MKCIQAKRWGNKLIPIDKIFAISDPNDTSRRDIFVRGINPPVPLTEEEYQKIISEVEIL